MPDFFREPRFLTASVVLLVLVLAVGLLQWRQLRTISDTELQRLRSRFNAAAYLSGEEVDRHVAHITDRLRVPADMADADEALGSAVEQWREVASHPELVSSVSWLGAGDRLPPGQVVGSSEVQLHCPEGEAARYPVLVLETADGRGVQVRLNGDYILDEWLPSLVGYFMDDEPTAFTAHVVPAGDANYTLAQWPETGRPLEHAAGIAAFPLLSMQYAVALSTVMSPDGSEGACWQLHLHPDAGSLEAVVAASFRASAILSFGTLGLLALTAVGSLIVFRRSADLARRRMQFVAGVSHELRTPLATLQAAGDNLADGVVDAPESVREYGREIRQQAGRLRELVDKALQTARLATVRPERQRVDVMRIAREVARQQSHDAGSRVELEAPDGPATAIGEADSVRLILTNLVQNALKHGPEDQTVRLRARSNGELVLISVCDEGEPIPAAERARIFEPFVRGNGADRVAGVGLGLSLARELARAQGGEVRLAVTEAGNQFTLELARARDAELGNA